MHSPKNDETGTNYEVKNQVNRKQNLEQNFERDNENGYISYERCAGGARQSRIVEGCGGHH